MTVHPPRVRVSFPRRVGIHGSQGPFPLITPNHKATVVCDSQGTPNNVQSTSDMS